MTRIRMMLILSNHSIFELILFPFEWSIIVLSYSTIFSVDSIFLLFSSNSSFYSRKQALTIPLKNHENPSTSRQICCFSHSRRFLRKKFNSLRKDIFVRSPFSFAMQDRSVLLRYGNKTFNAVQQADQFYKAEEAHLYRKKYREAEQQKVFIPPCSVGPLTLAFYSWIPKRTWRAVCLRIIPLSSSSLRRSRRWTAPSRSSSPPSTTPRASLLNWRYFSTLLVDCFFLAHRFECLRGEVPEDQYCWKHSHKPVLAEGCSWRYGNLHLPSMAIRSFPTP